jgi:hypothetical protein
MLIGSIDLHDLWLQNLHQNGLESANFTVKIDNLRLVGPRAFGEGNVEVDLLSLFESLEFKNLSAGLLHLDSQNLTLKSKKITQSGKFLGTRKGKVASDAFNTLGLEDFSLEFRESSESISLDYEKDPTKPEDNPQNIPSWFLELTNLSMKNSDNVEFFLFLDSLKTIFGGEDPLRELPFSVFFTPLWSFEGMTFQNLSSSFQGFPFLTVEGGRFIGDFVSGEIPKSSENELQNVLLHFQEGHPLVPNSFSLRYLTKKEPQNNVYSISKLNVESPGFLKMEIFLAFDGFTKPLIDGFKTIPLAEPQALWSLKDIKNLSLLDLSVKVEDLGGFMMISTYLASLNGKNLDVFLDDLSENLRLTILTRLDPFVENAEPLSTDLSLFLHEPKSLQLLVKPELPLSLSKLYSDDLEPLIFKNGRPDESIIGDILKTIFVSLSLNQKEALVLKWRLEPQPFELGLNPSDSRQDGLGDMD